MKHVTRLISLFACVGLVLAACDPLGRDPASCVRPIGGRNILPFTSPMQPKVMALSPDGSKLAMTYAAPLWPDFGLFDLRSGTYRAWPKSDMIPERGTPQAGGFAGLSWSPNGDRVYAMADGIIHTLAIDRAAEQVAAPCKFCGSFDLSPSGVIAIAGALDEQPISGRRVYALRSIADPTIVWSHPMEVAYDLAWSPDGRKLAVSEVFRNARGEAVGLYRVFSHPSGTEYPAHIQVGSYRRPVWYNNEELAIPDTPTNRLLRWNPTNGMSSTIATIGPEYKIPGGLIGAMTREGSQWIVLEGHYGVFVVDRSCVRP